MKHTSPSSEKLNFAHYQHDENWLLWNEALKFLPVFEAWGGTSRGEEC